MTGVTVRAVIDIALNFFMLLVHRGLLVFVTIRAGEHGEIRRIHVAIVAAGPHLP